MKLLGGAEYVRVDLHSHTIADKKFKDEQWKNKEDFIVQYVEQLQKQNISIVAITNHNKFDREEYCLLKEKAWPKGILVLPGVEISTSDGKRGVHFLCIFPQQAGCEDNNSQCKIESFITLMFPNGGLDSNNNPKISEKNIDQMVNILEKELKCRHYMLIPAHVDNEKGWFKECDMSVKRPYIKEEWIRKRIMAFQGINESSRRAYENEVSKIAKEEGIKQQVLIPAYIEASDPKGITEVGNKYSLVKVGELSFEALYFALSQHELRVLTDGVEKEIVPRIKNVRFLTQKGLAGIDIQFNEGLNNFIGIRGSGKSTIIEGIRYAFELEAQADLSYKNDLIEKHLGSGGKVVIEVIDKIGNMYKIERIFGHQAKVFKNDEYLSGLRPCDLMPVVYYGQKDLQKKMEDSKLQMGFIDQYIREDIESVRQEITEKEDEIKSLFSEIKRLQEKIEKKKEFTERLAGVNKDIDDFKRLKIADKLQLEAAYKKDEIALKRIKSLLDEIKNKSHQYEAEVLNIIGSISFPESDNNQDLFDRLKQSFVAYKQEFTQALKKLSQMNDSFSKEFTGINTEYGKRKESIEEQIAEIKREMSHIRELSIDDYAKRIEEKEKCEEALKQIAKYEKELIKKRGIKEQLLERIEDLWYELYQIRVKKAEEINKSQNIIRIEVQYKGDKGSFLNKIDDMLAGTGVRKEKKDVLSKKFSDGIELFKALVGGESQQLDFLSENDLFKIKQCLMENESELCLYRVPDIIRIFYNDKPLEQLSLGERSSSLLMLLLKTDNNPLIMDQPEDDLDNQMIYEGLVKELLTLKSKRQIIFATHNSNIPVLGDCDQGIVCENKEGKIIVKTGSIDTGFFQESIVKIMEGGEDAFAKRKEIYEKWML